MIKFWVHYSGSCLTVQLGHAWCTLPVSGWGRPQVLYAPILSPLAKKSSNDPLFLHKILVHKVAFIFCSIFLVFMHLLVDWMGNRYFGGMTGILVVWQVFENECQALGIKIAWTFWNIEFLIFFNCGSFSRIIKGRKVCQVSWIGTIDIGCYLHWACDLVYFVRIEEKSVFWNESIIGPRPWSRLGFLCRLKLFQHA
jgi:hypothetical protein